MSEQKDVVVKVKTLNVDETTPEGIEAKRVIEEKIIPRLASEDVKVIVIHKPSNQSASADVKLPQVKEYAREAIGDFPIDDDGNYAYVNDFVIVEVHKSGKTRVSSMETL